MGSKTYSGDLFGPWEPGRSFSARVEQAYDGFRFSLEDGRSFEVPYGQAKLSRGGFDGLGIIIEGPAESGEQLYVLVPEEGFVSELEATGHPDLRRAAAHLAAAGDRARASWLASHFLLVLFILGSIGFLWFGISYVSAHAASWVPVSVESSLGEMTAGVIVNSRQKLKSGPVHDAVFAVWARVAEGIKNSPYSFQLYVVDSSMVNALAAPGGHVVVFSGLLNRLESPEELAGILAHEAQHALKRHGLQSIIKNAGISVTLALLFGDTGALGELFRSYGGQLLSMSYSRDFEREADRGAAEILTAADIDPTKFPAFFTRISSGSGHLENTLAILSTHPAGMEREKRLQELFKTLPVKAWRPINVDWAAVKKALKDAPPPPDPEL